MTQLLQKQVFWLAGSIENNYNYLSTNILMLTQCYQWFVHIHVHSLKRNITVEGKALEVVVLYAGSCDDDDVIDLVVT